MFIKRCLKDKKEKKGGKMTETKKESQQQQIQLFLSFALFHTLLPLAFFPSTFSSNPCYTLASDCCPSSVPDCPWAYFSQATPVAHPLSLIAPDRTAVKRRLDFTTSVAEAPTEPKRRRPAAAQPQARAPIARKRRHNDAVTVFRKS